MSRADELRTRFEAELAVVQLEEALVAAKEAGDVPRELKEQLREARAIYRTLREGEAPGEGVARPEAVDTSSGVGS